MKMANGQRLELTWFGKEKEIKVEPRLLIENPKLSYQAESKSFFDNGTTDNMLIQGDNLLALKALEYKFTGKVKLIYIDPPYNTGAAFEHYDDNLEHSTWLSLMRGRLKILRNLLIDDGTIFIQIDDNEQAYLKVLCDEVFGRNNFVNMISVKAKASSGASGGGEDKRLKKNIEYILIYSRSNAFDSFKTLYQKTLLRSYISQREIDGVNFAYKSVLVNPGTEVFVGETKAGNGEAIKLFKIEGYQIKSVSQLSKEENLTQHEIYDKYINSIFTLENAQTSIRQRVIDAVGSEDDFYLAKYYPVSGKFKGQETAVGFIGKTKRLVSYLKHLVDIEDGKVYKKDKIGTLWDDLSWSSVFNEGDISFPFGKKPENLLHRIIDMSTNPGDIVLDSFLGSGTTIAVAHKMKRRWIGIEMGNQAYTHCKYRIDKIINNQDQSGVSKFVKWQGGGGYKFYELAPTLIKVDDFGQEIINPEYDANMLAAAIALHEGYVFSPDENIFWKQAKNGDRSFLLTTTKHINKSYLDTIHNQMLDDEFLIISCKSFDTGIERYYKNISIKKIPQSLLKNCEFGVDNYNLNIVNPPVYEEEDE